MFFKYIILELYKINNMIFKTYNQYTIRENDNKKIQDLGLDSFIKTPRIW